MYSQDVAEMVIHQMREARPAYNVISNNCQNYAVNLLDAIQIGAHQEFATSFAVYQRATGAGTIKDLFIDNHPEEQKVDITQSDANLDPDRPGFQRTDTVQNAQHVMDENTTKLDNHRKFFSWFSASSAHVLCDIPGLQVNSASAWIYSFYLYREELEL